MLFLIKIRKLRCAAKPTYISDITARKANGGEDFQHPWPESVISIRIAIHDDGPAPLCEIL